MPTRTKTASINKTPVARNKGISKKKAASKKIAAKKSTAKSVNTKRPTIQTLKLDSVTVINNAESLYKKFCKIRDNADINIDASAVKMIDTAILQLLYAFVEKTQASKHTVNWINPSDEFVSRATLLGLSQHMGLN